MKFKRVLTIVAISILSVITLYFVFLNSVAIGVLFSPINLEAEEDKEVYEQYEIIKWKYETELQFLNSYCEIQKALPEEEPTIGINVYYNSEEIEISSALNPFPEYTTMYELGRVEYANSEDINTEDGQVRLYRIEVIGDPHTYVEYISDRNDPYLYLVKDVNSSEFLIYPILFNETGEIDSQYYVEIL